jgi:hypothetical protein
MDMGGRELKNRSPTDEEFARASAAMKYRSRGLSDVRDKILLRFHEILHEFFIRDCSETSFIAIVFFRLERQIEESKRSGFASQIEEAVFEEMESVGRGGRNMIEIRFDFDSHERVERVFNGNYFNRLR